MDVHAAAALAHVTLRFHLGSRVNNTVDHLQEIVRNIVKRCHLVKSQVHDESSAHSKPPQESYMEFKKPPGKSQQASFWRVHVLFQVQSFVPEMSDLNSVARWSPAFLRLSPRQRRCRMRNVVIKRDGDAAVKLLSENITLLRRLSLCSCHLVPASNVRTVTMR